MARIRSAPRNASRHTGRMYQQGRQFEFNEIQTTHLGPWSTVVNNPMDKTAQQTVTSVYPYRIQDGKLTPFWVTSRMGTLTGAYTYLSGGSTILNGELWRFIFATETSSGNLVVLVYDNVGNLTVADTAETSTGYYVDWTMQGQILYFVQPQVKQFFSYNLPGGSTTFTTTLYAQTTGPTAFYAGKYPVSKEPWFIFNLDNNVTFVTQDGSNPPQLHWFADSLTRTTGQPGGIMGTTGASIAQPGSGNYNFSGQYGEVTSVALFDNAAWIVTEFGCIRMAPTGTLPAFRFEDIQYITGSPVFHGASGGSAGVFYVGRDGRARLTQGGQPQIVGQQGPKWNPTSGTLYVRYLSAIDSWVVWDTTLGDLAGQAWLFDAVEGSWSCDIQDSVFTTAYHAITTQYPAATHGGSYDAEVVELFTPAGILRRDFAWLDTNGTSTGTITTPWMNLGEEAHIQYIDIWITDVDGFDVDIDSVEIDVMRNGTSTNVEGTLVNDNGYVQRWAINSLTNTYRVKIDVTVNGGVAEMVGIGGIDIVWTPASVIEGRRLRG